ncbi:MAG: UxaA family hydrolase [Caldilineaceae bacterium]|nr:UxaA family hydrolase [Caldilineaceae bacterium]
MAHRDRPHTDTRPDPDILVPFDAVARLPQDADNVAIATRRLEAGLTIEHDGRHFTLDTTILVGHRFAIEPIAEGEPLLSWGLPFGVATRPIATGQYVCNTGMIEALGQRALDFTIPQQSNFQDRIIPYEVDEATFRPGQQVEPYNEEFTFLGFRRAGGRGVGTRNTIVILGTTSSTAAFARSLAQALQPAAAPFPGFDGIVAIAHTEGSGYERLNNRDFVLRTLAGLIVHPNVGAVLAVDTPELHPTAGQSISNAELESYLRTQNYPLAEVTHRFYTLTGDWQADLAEASATVKRWLPEIAALPRTPQSLAYLNIALQCGGSDAFSGLSGNPLASAVAKEVIRYGGRANLAETDELIGAEAYLLQNTRDLATAQAFLDYVAQFKERLAWHGQTAEGNPTGGNKLRGLYNIALKSIGAAIKRHPDVRLDWTVDYGERMVKAEEGSSLPGTTDAPAPGFYFMNTPGNDLESIAGQVAGGSNLIIFVTGNGSITNFPFVPTIKVMTTTPRFELLSNEMDVNAGAYLDGTSMDRLCKESLDLLVEIASGRPSKGELAGHSQISIWRNWQQQDHSRLQSILERPQPDGQPLSIRTQPAETEGIDLPQPPAARVGLILPTSLCSGQIAGMAAQRLNRAASEPQTGGSGEAGGRTLFAALPHTEGCGVAFASTQAIYARTMIGYATHPLVGACLFLEHGCEKAHNDYIHSLLRDGGLAEEDFGWASVQLDGGIASVLDKIDGYFADQEAALRRKNGHDRHLSLALLSDGAAPPAVADTLARIVRWVVADGGTVVTPASGGLIEAPAFRTALGLEAPDLPPSLAYGQAAPAPGFHLMEMPTPHWSETLTGLGASGAHLIIAYSDKLRAGHPLVPLLQLAGEHAPAAPDLRLCGDFGAWPQQILDLAAQTLAGDYQSHSTVLNHIDFQLTRGLLGIST